jgi:SAM-dependent methyltransferase
MSISERHEIEERFHDQHAGETGDFWEYVRPMFVEPEACLRLYAGIAGGSPGRVLEIGCGDGTFTLELLRSGAKVTAIDISAGQIAVACRRVAEAGFLEKVVFLHLNAEELTFENAFDVIVGKSILHHLDLENVAPKISRALVAGGTAVFLEPLVHNPFLNIGRIATPEMRTPTEKPLSLHEIQRFSSYFTSIKHEDFHLMSLCAFFWYYVVRNPRLFSIFEHALSKVDAAIFALFPFMRRYAWITVLQVRKGLLP